MDNKYYKNRFKGFKPQKRNYAKQSNTENKVSQLPLQMMLSVTSRRINNNKNNNNKITNDKTTVQDKINNHEEIYPEMHSFEILNESSNSFNHKENDLDFTFTEELNKSPIFSFDANDLIKLKNNSPEIGYYNPQNKYKFLPKIQPFIRTFQSKKHIFKENNNNNEAYLNENTQSPIFSEIHEDVVQDNSFSFMSYD